MQKSLFIEICLACAVALAHGACVLPEVGSADVPERMASMPSSGTVEPSAAQKDSAVDQQPTMREPVGAPASAADTPSGGSPAPAQPPRSAADGGMSKSDVSAASGAPMKGAPCSDSAALYCLELGTTQLLKCDGEHWSSALCDVVLDWSCEQTSGSIDELCVFKTPMQCAGVPPGGRTCFGQYVHECQDAQSSRRVEFCGGDLAMCTNGTCGSGASVCPQRLATLPHSNARRLSVSGAYLFWIDESAPGIGRVSTDGTGQTTIASAAGALGDILADGTYVFWTELKGGRVMRAAPDGSGAIEIATGQMEPRDLASDNAAVYWVNGGSSGSLMKTAKADGTPMPLVTMGSVSSVLVIDGFAYFDFRHDIQRVPTGGGDVSKLTSVADSEPIDKLLSASATHLYFSASRSSISFIGRVPLQGGPTSQLDIPAGPPSLAVDAQHVYYGNNVVDVMRCALDGTNPQIVFHSLNGQVHDIALDESSIYFSAGDAIYKLPK
ncbi:MAG TPA: hypothetical protein VFN67_35280 [Polyangiales bacterium]|nr:hypothetical protein [Polyangiales bacterium]